jgi:hypothetical protein
MPCSPALRRSLPAALALSLSAAVCGAAPVIQVNPGLWTSDSEIWINGQSMRPGIQALQAKLRSKLSEAQKAELDRAQATEKQATYLESTLKDSGPWKCEVTPSKLDAAAADGSYVCRTGGGGLTQGKFSATYGPTSYRLELNGRGNAVDGRTGTALGGTEMDQRMLSTGRWLGASC